MEKVWTRRKGHIIAALLAACGMPSSPALAQAGPGCSNRAFVANSYANTLSVIDTSTNRIIATLPMPSPYSPVLSGDGKRVYVANTNQNNISIVDALTNRVSTLATPDKPIGVAVTPDNRHVLTIAGELVNGSTPGPGRLRRIDLATGKSSPPIEVGYAERVFVSPDGRQAYVSSKSRLIVVDLAGWKIRTIIPLVGDAVSMLITSDGKKIYLALSRPNLIGVVDTSRRKVERYIPVGSEPIGLAFGPGERSLFITNNRDGTLQELSLATHEVTMTKKVGDRPGLLAVSADGKRAYIMYSSAKSVGVVDLSGFNTGPSMPLAGYKGYPGQVNLPPLPQITLDTGAPTSVAMCRAG